MSIKIFITIPWFTPAYRAGGPIQSIHNLVNTFTEDIEYKIFCGSSDLNGELLKEVKRGAWIPHNEHTQIWYAGEENVSHTLSKQIEHGKPDVLYIIGLFNWHFNIVPLLFCKVPKKILSVRGMLHPAALLQKKWKKWFFIKGLKILGIKNKIIFQATDQIEEKYIKDIFGKNTIVLIAGNFAKHILPKNPVYKTSGILKLVTIAIISPMKNYLMIINALMQCDAAITYSIYGPIKDDNYWQQCLKMITKLPANIAVTYYGETAPSNIQNILSSHHVFIMPSQSENFGHSISESLSAGKPVITSHSTPWNNLNKHMAGLNVNSTPVEIKIAITKFASMDNNTYLQYVNGAIAYHTTQLSNTNKEIAYRKLFFNN